MRNLYKFSFLLIAIISCVLLLSCGGATVKKGEGNFKKLPNGGEVNGPRSVENIEENFKMLVPRFEYFFKKRLRINPELKGTVQFVLDIDANGDVIYSSIGKSTTNDPDFDDEILHAISLHKFGQWTQGRGKTEVIYPFSFSQEGAAEEKVKPPETKPTETKPPETKPVEKEIKPPEEAPDEEVDFDDKEKTEEEAEEEETEEESEGFLDDE